MYLKLDEFNKMEDIPDYYNFKRPCVIRGGCKSMKIFSEKDILHYIHNKLKDKIVTAEIYENLKDMEMTDVKIHIDEKFSKTYDYIINNKTPYRYIADVELNEARLYNDELLNNFRYNIDDNRENNGTLLFFGNNGCSGAHIHGANDYILNQIVGKKTFIMCEYSDNDLEIFPLSSDRVNFLKENIINLDPSKYKLYKVELNPGDSITIPPWWWHATTSNDISLSITKTYDRTNNLFMFYYPRILVMNLYELMYDIIDFSLYYNEIILLVITIIVLILSYIYIK